MAGAIYEVGMKALYTFSTGTPEEVGHASSIYDVKLQNQAFLYVLRLEFL